MNTGIWFQSNKQLVESASTSATESLTAVLGGLLRLWLRLLTAIMVTLSTDSSLISPQFSIDVGIKVFFHIL
ncbi:hypothetical protein PanWU01x14_249540 [Parasponia andersonii]|uniref:Uncharacterized protein n=1 Tax=Parasponia andersonii TaxID=3476 RepID=A0A2P5BD08_PARAD|nr:hypothetical protein PanWU01x14_249540 [Parasponia andersonii]